MPIFATNFANIKLKNSDFKTFAEDCTAKQKCKKITHESWKFIGN